MAAVGHTGPRGTAREFNVRRESCNMLLLLIVVPLLAAALAVATPNNRLRPWLLPLTATIHLGLLTWLLPRGNQWMFGRWLRN